MNSPPSTLGQYQIIREIARSNDIVYEAYDPLMNRRVAIKELAMPQGASSQQQEERISRFRREAQAAGTLNHPNIMTVFQIAEEGGRTFMAMEYLDGCTLRNEVDAKGYLPIDRAVEVAVAVLEGLSHAHSKGVIHRDIKPDNIQLLSNGAIKITDFGIARLTFQPNLTMDGQVFGTPSYMSPEQVVGREIDPRSDLFSVGVVIYEMISGQKPFAGDSVVSITYAIMNAEPAHPQQANFALWQFLTRALDKSPQMRFPNADEMIQALRDVQSSTQSGAMGASASNSSAPFAVNPYQPSVPSSGVVPPPVYAYNPYAPQPNMAPSPYQTSPYQPSIYQYQAGPSMLPPAAVPIYYPPPPRRPLVSPETASVMQRILIAILILGTLILLLLVGMSALTDLMTNARTDSHDVTMEKQIVFPPNMPTDEKIKALTTEIGRIQSPGVKADLNHQLATLYEKQGNDDLDHADSVSAEYAFKRGTELDPNNPSLWSDEAHVQQSLLTIQTDPADQCQTLLQVGAAYDKAARFELKDAGKRGSYIKSAIEAYEGYGQKILYIGDRTTFDHARIILNAARDLVQRGSDDDQALTNLIQKMS